MMHTARTDHSLPGVISVETGNQVKRSSLRLLGRTSLVTSFVGAPEDSEGLPSHRAAMVSAAEKG